MKEFGEIWSRPDVKFIIYCLFALQWTCTTPKIKLGVLHRAIKNVNSPKSYHENSWNQREKIKPNNDIIIHENDSNRKKTFFFLHSTLSQRRLHKHRKICNEYFMYFWYYHYRQRKKMRKGRLFQQEKGFELFMKLDMIFPDQRIIFVISFLVYWFQAKMPKSKRTNR